jgi:hypothetical protein
VESATINLPLNLANELGVFDTLEAHSATNPILEAAFQVMIAIAAEPTDTPIDVGSLMMLFTPERNSLRRGAGGGRFCSIWSIRDLISE